MKVVVIPMSIIAVLVALASPGRGLRVAFVLAAALAVTFGVERIVNWCRAIPAAKPEARTIASFRRDLPQDLAMVAGDLRLHDLGAASHVSLQTQGTLYHLAVSRLRVRYGYDIGVREHWFAIASTVSPQLWELIRPESQLRHGHGQRLVRLGQLRSLIEEIERL